MFLTEVQPRLDAEGIHIEMAEDRGVYWQRMTQGEVVHVDALDTERRVVDGGAEAVRHLLLQRGERRPLREVFAAVARPR